MSDQQLSPTSQNSAAKAKDFDLVSYAKLFYPPKEVEVISRAVDLARTAHTGQYRKSGWEYINHPLNVAKILVDWKMDLNSVVAGVLHDVIEDTDYTFEQIRDEFGEDVAFLVDGVTKVSVARSGMKDLSKYAAQTTDNLAKLLIATSQDVRVIIVKLADRLHNLSELQYLKPEKQLKIARESLEVFAPMADRIGMGRVRMQIEEISFRYLDPKRYHFLEKLMRKRLGKSTRRLGIVRLEVEKELKRNKINFEINGRVKSIYSLHKKMLKKHDNIDDIYDLIALRIIVESKDDCYRVLGILHSIYQPMVARIKDYIAVPKANGYQSLHTTVITPTKQIVEFQIRTRDMHQYAEQGLAASFHYHQQKSSKNYLKRGVSSVLPTNLQWISQLQEVAHKLTNHEEIDRDQLTIDLFKDRIFVYSPKGDIYNLPDGALPLDFAYQVHSKIGGHAYGFLINNRMAAFNTPLQNGDLVEVLTKKSVNPRPDWLDLVTTSHARAKLKAQLKRQTK
ncbi:MAG: RelA/SpoT family protein [Candidatus Saccharibacteria bacterium]|nr:RelA/SpoT family protein [Candidatus Saccharibacteria bacterium]